MYMKRATRFYSVKIEWLFMKFQFPLDCTNFLRIFGFVDYVNVSLVRTFTFLDFGVKL